MNNNSYNKRFINYPNHVKQKKSNIKYSSQMQAQEDLKPLQQLNQNLFFYTKDSLCKENIYWFLKKYYFLNDNEKGMYFSPLSKIWSIESDQYYQQYISKCFKDFANKIIEKDINRDNFLVDIKNIFKSFLWSSNNLTYGDYYTLLLIALLLMRTDLSLEMGYKLEIYNAFYMLSELVHSNNITPLLPRVNPVNDLNNSLISIQLVDAILHYLDNVPDSKALLHSIQNILYQGIQSDMLPANREFVEMLHQNTFKPK